MTTDHQNATHQLLTIATGKAESAAVYTQWVCSCGRSGARLFPTRWDNGEVMARRAHKIHCKTTAAHVTRRTNAPVVWGKACIEEHW